jgi:hypothetical protein
MTHYRTAAGLLSLAISATVFGAVDTTPKPVPVHVITMTMDEETGVAQPSNWHRAEWPDFRCVSEDEFREALRETEQERIRSGMGKIAVRAYDRKHKLICRGISTVVVWRIADENRELVKRPVFGVVVPAATKLFRIEGWMQSTTGTFDIDQIAARFSDASP